MTNAELARIISTMNLATSQAMRDLAEGMWNPDFCSADASKSQQAMLLLYRMARSIATLATVSEAGHAVSQEASKYLAEAVRRLG